MRLMIICMVPAFNTNVDDWKGCVLLTITFDRDAVHRGARALNALGKAMGEEIDSQNTHIDRITNKTDKVDDQIAVNRARLDRIR